MVKKGQHRKEYAEDHRIIEKLRNEIGEVVNFLSGRLESRLFENPKNQICDSFSSVAELLILSVLIVTVNVWDVVWSLLFSGLICPSTQP